MKHIRCSRLPLVATCPQSTQTSAVTTNWDSDAARMGTAVHQVLAEHVGGGSPNIQEIASWHAVDEDECRMLSHTAMGLYRQISDYYPSPKSEVHATHQVCNWLALSGTADVVSVVGDEVRILDWKSGWADGDWIEQLKGYAWLQLQSNPDCNRAYVAVLRVRSGEITGAYFKRETLEGWVAELALEVKRAERSQDYRPGSHCLRCPRSNECPALRRHADLSRHWLVGTSDFLEIEGSGVTSSGLLRMLDACKFLQSLLDRVRDQLKAAVAAAGGMIEANGRRLELVEQTQTKIVANDDAWQAITSVVPPEEAWESVAIGKTKLAELVRRHAPPRQGKQAMQDLMDDLTRKNCVRTTVVTKLEAKNVRTLTDETTDVNRRIDCQPAAGASPAEMADDQSVTEHAR